MINWNDVIKFASHLNPVPEIRIEKTDEEWKGLLNEEVYRVTRKKGTEARFSGEHCTLFEPGVYSCVCCNTALFDSEEKFESGTGWPSFTQPIKENAVKYVKDVSYGMTRIEALCNRCDAHLGHVFSDGPEPYGLRFCINSVSLSKNKAVKNEK